MREGDMARLVPCISKIKDPDERTQDLMDALTEDVRIIRLNNGTGNTKVRDKYGIVFYCNPSDLSGLL